MKQAISLLDTKKNEAWRVKPAKIKRTEDGS